MNAQRQGRTVIVGVDGSEPAQRAVRWAAREAARRGLPLEVVTAFDWPQDHALGQASLGASHREIMLGAARQQLAEAVQMAQQEQPEVEVCSQLVVGHPIPVMTAESRRGQMVVIGDRGLGGVTGLLVGSVAVGLGAHSQCPVVIVRGEAEEPDPGRPVVVGVDGSPTSEAALEFAYEAAALRKVPLVAVHTWQAELPPLFPAMAPMPDWDSLMNEEREVLAERLAGWGEKYPDVQVHRLVVTGHPSRTLVEESEGAQLLVVGSRGRGGFGGLVLGSVSHAVLHRAHCPVVVVRPETEATG